MSKMAGETDRGSYLKISDNFNYKADISYILAGIETTVGLLWI